MAHHKCDRSALRIASHLHMTNITKLVTTTTILVITYVNPCLSVEHMNELCKVAELIETPFGKLACVGPRNHILHGIRIPHGNGHS